MLPSVQRHFVMFHQFLLCRVFCYAFHHSMWRIENIIRCAASKTRKPIALRLMMLDRFNDTCVTRLANKRHANESWRLRDSRITRWMPIFNDWPKMSFRAENIWHLRGRFLLERPDVNKLLLPLLLVTNNKKNITSNDTPRRPIPGELTL